MRNLQEQVEKALCCQKLFWPFTVWIYCSWPSASNFKSFSRSIEFFFLTVGQINFGNKIPLIPLLYFPALRCQCLGDFSNRNYSINALDMYCRNETWPEMVNISSFLDKRFQRFNRNKKNTNFYFSKIFQVMPSGTAFDQNTIEPLDMIVPYKTRCGSLDPLEMSEETKCNCWQTSGEGSCKFFWYFEL